MVAGATERLARLNLIKKIGRFEWNENEEINDYELSTERRPNEKFQRDATDFETCSNCLGSYAPSTLRHHFRTCTNKEFFGERVAKEKSRQIEARVHAEACNVLVDKVFPSMHQTDASLSIRFDWIIITYANVLCFNLSPHDQLLTVKKYLREAGHLLIAVRSICTEVSDFASLYNAKYCNAVITAIHIVAKYDDNLKAFKSPGTAAALVTLVNTIGDHLKVEYIRLDNNVKKKNVSRFLKVFHHDSKTKINKMVTINRLKARREKPENIPTTDDVEKLATYLDKERTACFLTLSEKYLKQNWRRLVELTSMSILVFNRKRVGDTQNVLLSEYNNREFVNNHKSPESSNDIIKSRMQIRGKLYRTVPVLLKESFEKCLELLLHYRKKTGVPEHNHYLFALPSKSGKIIRIKADVLFRKFSNECNADNPSSLRGTNLRKHFASLCGTMDLSDNDVSNIAQFMGHSEKVHRDVYRQSTLQQEVKKMSTLLDIAQGKNSSLAGNSEVLLSTSNATDQTMRKRKKKGNVSASQKPKKQKIN